MARHHARANVNRALARLSAALKHGASAKIGGGSASANRGNIGPIVRRAAIIYGVVIAAPTIIRLVVSENRRSSRNSIMSTTRLIVIAPFCLQRGIAIENKHGDGITLTSNNVFKAHTISAKIIVGVMTGGGAAASRPLDASPGLKCNGMASEAW